MEPSINIEKLKWRSKRSILELDLFFDSYIKGGYLDSLSGEYLQTYNELLQLDDDEILLLFQGKLKTSNPKLQFIVSGIISSNR